jgi:putative transposase
MGARLRVFLTGEQDRTLFNLKTAEVPQKVKDRAQVIRLNALSIIGFLQPLISFVYALVIGGVNRKSYIHMMEKEALLCPKSWTYDSNSTRQRFHFS